LVKQVVKDASV